MAIQTINDALPNGDTPRDIHKKINENFSHGTHAASRLIGSGLGDVSENRELFNSAYQSSTLSGSTYTPTNANEFPLGRGVFGSGPTTNTPTSDAGAKGYVVIEAKRTGSGGYQIGYSVTESEIFYRACVRLDRDNWTPWVKMYNTGNTTKEEGTGYLVASSPVLKMQHDSFEKVHEAEQLDIGVKNIKTGVYEIKGTTGLREGDGWNLKPPKDVNGNVLCICEATESNGVITLKTYRKKFDFETVSIVADYDQPTDIPEGATVMLRFNDLPQEHLDEPEPVEEPIVEEVVEEEPSEEFVEEPEVVEEVEDPVVVEEDPKD